MRERIRRAAERSRRDPAEIQLVAVTKTVPAETIALLGELDQTDIGENRVQEAADKFGRLTDGFRHHLIGHLQTNKVKKAVELFEVIHSVDSVRLAEALHKEAQKQNKYISALLQVNVSSEETKFGITPQDLFNIYSQIKEKIDNLKSDGGIVISGLMTITPLLKTSETAEVCRPYFRQLRELLAQLRRQTGDSELKYL
ncbi:MAG: YggS family pyridoxal phosphate-dependent enzyme [Planctomycetes bacterium]|nr:YggS family pyridoxal phosphate-dependent enzyme [Planctomycetota bacterium]